MNKILEWDENFFLYLNSLGEEKWDKFWIYCAQIENWIPFYLILFYFVFRAIGFKKTFIALVLVGLGVFFSELFTYLIKYMFKRYRPCYDPVLKEKIRLLYRFFPKGAYGFSSGHAAMHFSFAIFISKLLKPHVFYAPYFFFIWAGIISYSRLYIGAHYPLDVAIGALLGLSVGFFSFFLYQNQKYLLKIPFVNKFL